jgi:hypothetical protein
MDEDTRTEEFAQAFRQAADQLNHLSPQERADLRARFGEYAHDFKHILGLVMGANSVLQRDDAVMENQGDMLEIIEDAAKRLDASFDLFVQNLANQITLDE